MKLKYPDDLFAFASSVFIAPNTSMVGKVTIGKNSSVWYQSVLRGDVDEIIIGENCNIQDGSIIHCVGGFPTIMGDNVSLGHAVLLHGCQLGNNILVGMRATVLTGAKIGDNCLIAAGSLIPEGMEIPSNSLVVGSPAVVKKQVNEKHLQLIDSTWQNYVDYAKEYLKRKRNA